MSYIISDNMKPPQNLLDEMSKVLEEYRIKKEGFTRDQLAEAISQALMAGDFVKFVEGTDRQAIVYIPYWGRNFVAKERDKYARDNERLRSALQFYSDYFNGLVPFLDKGKRAREALAPENTEGLYD